MTRMERRRRRTRIRRLQILVVAVVIALFIVICNAIVVAEERDAETLAEKEPTYTATTLDFQQQEAGFRMIEDYKPTALEAKHAAPVQDDDTIIRKADESPEEEPEPVYEKLYTEQDVIAMAQMAYGECWITRSDTEMSWSMWCVCNRFDSGDPFYRDCESLYDIIAQNGQFHGYDPSNPIEDRLVELARDVMDRWSAEKQGVTDVGRTLPAEYLYFWGDGFHNHFTTEWQGGIEYDGHLGTPYDN